MSVKPLGYMTLSEWEKEEKAFPLHLMTLSVQAGWRCAPDTEVAALKAGDSAFLLQIDALTGEARIYVHSDAFSLSSMKQDILEALQVSEKDLLWNRDVLEKPLHEVYHQTDAGAVLSRFQFYDEGAATVYKEKRDRALSGHHITAYLHSLSEEGAQR